MSNPSAPKIKHDCSQLTGDSLQQAWSNEAKQRRWRRAYWSLAIIIAIIVIVSLVVTSWPILKTNWTNKWSVWLKNKAEQTIDSIHKWQLQNEQTVIEGNIFK